MKDLRIIKNKRLKDMVIVDNLARSFSFQLDNGIPVQSYYGCHQDRILLKLGSFLKKVAEVEDIPDFLSSILNLRKKFCENSPKLSA